MEILHVRVSRRAVNIKIVFLYILTMIALAVGQTEKPFFDDRVFLIPQGDRKTEMLLVVRKTD